MLFAKSCSRCRGDLTLVFDIDESYFQCVQCGYMTYQRPGAVVVPSVPSVYAANADAVAPRGSTHRNVGSGHDRGTRTRRSRGTGATRGR